MPTNALGPRTAILTDAGNGANGCRTLHWRRHIPT